MCKRSTFEEAFKLINWSFETWEAPVLNADEERKTRITWDRVKKTFHVPLQESRAGIDNLTNDAGKAIQAHIIETILGTNMEKNVNPISTQIWLVIVNSEIIKKDGIVTLQGCDMSIKRFAVKSKLQTNIRGIL